MGNVSGVAGDNGAVPFIDPPRLFVKRDESFGSKSPRQNANVVIRNPAAMEGEYWRRAGRPAGAMGGGEKRESNASSGRSRNGSTSTGETVLEMRYQNNSRRHNRSQSSEQSGAHSPSSSRSSSSNSYINSMLAKPAADRSCLRQSTEPMFNISGDLSPHQIGLIKRAWKVTMKAAGNDEMEVALLILLRIFQLDERNLSYFCLDNVPLSEQSQLRHNPIFVGYVKTYQPTLVHVMNHLTNATTLSKHLQQLGGKHVNYTGVTYKCSYWKTFTQALIDVLSEQRNNVELQDALSVLGTFCVEQMRIGYRIEYKLQCEAERLAQSTKRRNLQKGYKRDPQI